ncbi:MAG: rare lipoprotein [Verrucomicrobiales bacterium]|nr:rare lipoprotein [Verrucomicrobiales bacterium]
MNVSSVVYFFAFAWLLVGCSSLTSGQSARYPKTRVTMGTASYYSAEFHGHKTASGEIFDVNKLTAAHQTLSFGQKVRVTNLANDRSVDVIINDRGPFAHNRIIDLSPAAAHKLDMTRSGTAKVSIELLGQQR